MDSEKQRLLDLRARYPKPDMRTGAYWHRLEQRMVERVDARDLEKLNELDLEVMATQARLETRRHHGSRAAAREAQAAAAAWQQEKIAKAREAEHKRLNPGVTADGIRIPVRPRI